MVVGSLGWYRDIVADTLPLKTLSVLNCSRITIAFELIPNVPCVKHASRPRRECKDLTRP
jgi:hypothetical protein